MAKIKNAKKRPAQRSLGDQIRRQSARTGVTKKSKMGRHSQAGKARMNWAKNRDLRVFIHVLRTNFNYDSQMNARIFTRAHPQELNKAGFTDGMPAQALKDQYDQRGASGRPIELWNEITAVNQTPAEMAKRQQMINNIQQIANQIAREDVAELNEDEAEEDEDGDDDVEGDEAEQDIEEEDDARGSKRRGTRGRRGRAPAPANTDEEDDDDLPLAPIAPKPVCGAKEMDAFRTRSQQQALAQRGYGGCPAGGNIGHSYQPTTAPTIGMNPTQSNIFGNHTSQASAMPGSITDLPTDFGAQTLNRPALPAHMNPYMSSTPFAGNAYQRTIQRGHAPMTYPQGLANTAPFPSPYDPTTQSINQAPQFAAASAVQQRPPQTITTSNPYINALNLPATTLPEFQQPRVPIQPVQTRGITVDQAYVLQHMECDWEEAENDNGIIRYRVIENEKMWHSWDVFRLSCHR